MLQFAFGIIPFVVTILVLGLYLYIRSISRKTNSSLSEIRSSIRRYQKESRALARLSTTFSPSDPEPIGELSEKFNAQLVDLERIIAETYQKYGVIHQKANKLTKVPIWKFWIIPFGWLEASKEIEILWQDLDQIRELDQEARKAGEKITRLGDELSLQSKEVMEILRDALHIHHEISSQLDGEKFLLCGQNLKEWETTLQTQLPITFLAPVGNVQTDTTEKDSIALVHRILKSAKPEIEGLYGKVKNWQADLVFLSSSLEKLNSNQQKLAGIFSDLQTKTVSPLEWDKSQVELESLGQQLEKLNFEKKLITVDELRLSTQQVKRLISRQDELEDRCQNIQTNYFDLLRFWSSFEIQQGYDWVRNAGQVLEQVKTFNKANWDLIEDLDDFHKKFEELKQIQSIVLPRDPAKKIQEGEIDALVIDSRTLYDLHVELRPKLDRLSARLKELQRQQSELNERVVTAKSVLAKTIPIIASNPFLKKICGNTPQKMHTSLELLSTDLNSTQEGLFESKLRKISDWFERAEIVFDKWLMALTDEINNRNQELEERFQVLGNFNNLEDIVITEVRGILKKVEQGGGTPLSRPGDERLLVVGREIWAKNDLWQKIVSAVRALEDIAGPVVERYQKAEKSRQIAMKWMERGSAVIPEVLGWPPTTQNLNNERKQAQSLETLWNGMKWEHIQAIQLVGKLSDISEQYHGLALQLQQVVEKAEQEHGKVLEYERRIEESKKMWLEVVAKFPEYKNLKIDVEKLFVEVDRDFEGLKKRCTLGGLPYQQVLQNLRALIRKLNDAMMPAAGNQVIDINGELQKRIY